MTSPSTRQLPNEGRNGSWWACVLATCGQLLRRPGASFEHVPETIEHARVLGFVASLRLPLWLALLGVLSLDWAMRTEPLPWRPTALGQFLDPALVNALSRWVLLLVPLGIPLLYFLAGILAHVALSLTGGTRQSIGASMRAFGYPAALALAIVSALDLGLYLGAFADRRAYEAGFDGPELWACIVFGVLFVHFLSFALALARTHRVGLLRSLLSSALPELFFAAAVLGRASLELERVPFVPRPQPSPYAPILLE